MPTMALGVKDIWFLAGGILYTEDRLKYTSRPDAHIMYWKKYIYTENYLVLIKQFF